MKDIQMLPEYGAIYPQEGDIAADAPVGYVTMWSDFFSVCNLRLPLTVFVAEVLEWYKLYISLLSPFGMIQVRNFYYTFRAFGIEPTVGDFSRFYQMTVSIGFFSFHQRDGSPKLMVPPKGLTKWKMKFFYIKAAVITARLTFRNVTDPIISENISVPKADTVDWFPRLRIIRWKKLSNSQLWLLRMMLGRMCRKARPVVREKSGEDAPLWRMFCPDFKGKVEVLACADGEEGFNYTIRDNFRLPNWDAMEAVLPQGKGDLRALGDPDATGVPKQHMKKHGDKQFRRARKPHEPIVVPPMVPEVAETREEPDNVFATPPASPKAVGVETQKEDKRSLSIEVVTSPFVHADDTAQKPAVQTIDDTLDSSNNLIDPHDTENRGDGKPKSPVAEKPKSPVAEKASGSTAVGTGVEDQPTIQPGETELEFYYRSYAVDRSLDYHRPPWTVMKGNDEETARLRAEAEALVKAAREGAEQLKKEKAAFEKLKQTEAWAATADLKHVRTLAKLLSDECKGWREACARENEKLFRVRQELNNVKAANAALLKEKAAAEAATKEAKEAEARGAKVLEKADVDHSKLNKTVEELQV
ncbi:hypothetical protein HanPI659440_Chr09g0350291 [Helianthus annuus]|nr:hypothetical protein HanPI659440_Chr09g0350291 [Helianthus annuus]